jgi:hypothetical protein
MQVEPLPAVGRIDLLMAPNSEYQSRKCGHATAVTNKTVAALIVSKVENAGPCRV